MELHQRVTVQEGGRVEITLPETTPGETIDLTVLFTRETLHYPFDKTTPRKAGSLRGKIHVGLEFDDPIPGTEDYQ